MSASVRRPRVFISYAHKGPESTERVRALAAALEAQGCEVWTDRCYLDRAPPKGWKQA